VVGFLGLLGTLYDSFNLGWSIYKSQSQVVTITNYDAKDIFIKQIEYQLANSKQNQIEEKSFLDNWYLPNFIIGKKYDVYTHETSVIFREGLWKYILFLFFSVVVSIQMMIRGTLNR
jgi:hypothetical protein